MEKGMLTMLSQIANAIADQFGKNCEVAIHDPRGNEEDTVVYIVNELASGQSVGSGARHVRLRREDLDALEARGRITYRVKTPDERVLKNSAVCIKNEHGEAEAVLTMRYDVSKLMILESAIHDLVSTEPVHRQEPEKTLNVNELLDRLIEQAVELTGKPVAMMNKNDKIKAIQFLSRNGAFLVMKSGDKVAKHFGISKYTLYSYIDAKQQDE